MFNESLYYSLGNASYPLTVETYLGRIPNLTYTRYYHATLHVFLVLNPLGKTY